MNKLVKNRMVIISISLALLVLINIAVSYSYYLGKVVGNEASTTLSFTSAGVIIEYENNSGSITDTNIIPGWSTTKNFKVKSTMKANEGNNNDSKLGYAVKMIVDNNDFPTNSIAYSLVQGSKTGNGQAMEAATDVGIATGANSAGILLGTGYFVVGENEHNYTLTIKYMDSEAVDGNKNFGIHLVVETVRAVTVTVDLNGGTYIGSTTKYIPLGMAVSIEEPTKEGYTFNGWEITSRDGTVSGNKIIANSLAITVQAQYVKLQSFADDDWATIAANVQANKAATASTYKVGDTKEVTIDGTNYTVRIANNSNYDCTLDSKTACGFVVEFVDIITSYNMNPAGTYNGIYYEYGTNLGGWPSSAMYKYINGDTENHLTYGGTNATLYSKLPSELRNVIADTTVISGHGLEDKNTARTDENWESTDKLYLLSAGEIYGNCLTENCYDTASYPYNNSGATTTRQLDYYNGVTVTTRKNYEKAIKQKNGSNTWWWLRSAYAYPSPHFRTVNIGGSSSTVRARSSGGVAPAFRIA